MRLINGNVNKQNMMLVQAKSKKEITMKTIVKAAVLCAVMLCMVSITSYSWAGQWIGPGTVNRIEVQPNGNVYVSVSMAVPNLGCPLNGTNWIQLNTSYPHYKEQYSLLLAAMLANKQVEIYVHGCGDAYVIAHNTDIIN